LRVSSKQTGDGFHGKKKAVPNGGKRNEPKMPVELYCARIDRVHNNRRGGDFG